MICIRFIEITVNCEILHHQIKIQIQKACLDKEIIETFFEWNYK